MKNIEYICGIDVGSTTVKMVLLENQTDFPTIFKDYQRHHGKQAEKLYQILTTDALKGLNIFQQNTRAFITGSGAPALAGHINAEYIQEVNALSYFADMKYPFVKSIVELGGQDAKIIINQELGDNNRKRKFCNMNEKCAGGTGAILDRVIRKLGIRFEEINSYLFTKEKIHPVAGKCGIFAESDINSLLKQGVSLEECLISLFESIIQQNISTLTKGRMLHPPVMLLGGPNTFFKPLVENWKNDLTELWDQENIDYDMNKLDEIVFVPENAEYFPAIGCALLGALENTNSDRCLLDDLNGLRVYISGGKTAIKGMTGEPGLAEAGFDISRFQEKYGVAAAMDDSIRLKPKTSSIDVYLGMDIGSTSAKCIALNSDLEILSSVYRLSEYNPIEEAKIVLKDLSDNLSAKYGEFHLKSLCLTGYAKDFLSGILNVDSVVVETVAHMTASNFYYNDVDVIVDVGGHDIKIIFMKNGIVYDFKLNSQCSAGNGFYLQNAASNFNIEIEEFAKHAFKAEYIPRFNCGCAVFLESDIVNFQQQGWEPNEILAGLAKVLPKNIWEYIVQEQNLKKYGKKFVFQGGTHKNLAVVKAHKDYIEQRVPGAEVIVHRYCAETGALGAAIIGRARALDNKVERSRFIGFEELKKLEYTITRNAETQCNRCKNKCLRSFLDTVSIDSSSKRFIISSCEKGKKESDRDFADYVKKIKQNDQENPNYVKYLQQNLFKPIKGIEVVNNVLNRSSLSLINNSFNIVTRNKNSLYDRFNTRIGIPRILNNWKKPVFFTSYLQAIGIPAKNIIWSDVTTDKLWKEGNKRNSVDLCYPGKYGIAHIHNLLTTKQVDIIFNPALVSFKSEVTNIIGSQACPIVMANTEVLKASFTKGEDSFLKYNVAYLDGIFHLENDDVFEYDMHQFFRKTFNVGKKENKQAIQIAKDAETQFYKDLRQNAKTCLAKIVGEKRFGILFLGRPYHYDSGVNHDIMTELHLKGYPIFTAETLPNDKETVTPMFQEDLEKGLIQHPNDITDVWKYSISECTNLKVWAAKFASRHTNLAIVDFVSFRCGHDATCLHVIEDIARYSNTPYFAFHEMDQNRPGGSLSLRIETMDYYLKEFQKKHLQDSSIKKHRRMLG